MSAAAEATQKTLCHAVPSRTSEFAWWNIGALTRRVKRATN
jgi:hypothetical protein